MSKRVKYFRLQNVVRGFSSHRRIEIMELLKKTSERSLSEIADYLDINLKTAGEHTRRLVIAGLVEKRSDGQSMRHRLTSLGLHVLKFLRTLE